MTTLRLLTERTRLILSGGFPTISDRVGDKEIEHAIVAAASAVLKLSTIDMRYNVDGGSIPDDRMIVTYEGEYAIPVTRGPGGTCRAALPATPIPLPERVDIFAVYPTGEPDLAFMYVPAGAVASWRNNKFLNPIDTILFTTDSKNVIVYSDLIGAGIHKLDMQLCVVDIAQLGEYDPLPISGDMEDAVIDKVLERYGIEPKTVRKEGREASPA